MSRWTQVDKPGGGGVKDNGKLVDVNWERSLISIIQIHEHEESYECHNT